MPRPRDTSDNCPVPATRYAGIDAAAGRVLVGRLNGTSWIDLKSVTYGIQKDTIYHLKVLAVGSNIRIYINSNLVIEVNDTSFTSGSIGFSAWNTHAHFDNFGIYTQGTGKTVLYKAGYFLVCSDQSIINIRTSEGWSITPPEGILVYKDGRYAVITMGEMSSYVNSGWSTDPLAANQGGGNDVYISLDINTGLISYNWTKLSLPCELYDKSADKSYSHMTQLALALFSKDWYSANTKKERDNALEELRKCRQQISDDQISEAISKFFDGSIYTDLLQIDSQLSKAQDELPEAKATYLIGAVNYLAGNALNTGNKVHYDQINGGEGEWLPTELQAMYPNTSFRFARRGEAGEDVEYIKGPHPSDYPDNPMNWKPGNDFGDFKPGTESGWKTFLKDIKSGKLPENSEFLPYDPETGKLIKPETPIDGGGEPPIDGGGEPPIEL